MTIDHVFVLVSIVAFVGYVARGIRSQEAKDLASMADRRRARRALGRVHRATIQAPSTPRQGRPTMTHDAR